MCNADSALQSSAFMDPITFFFFFLNRDKSHSGYFKRECGLRTKAQESGYLVSEGDLTSAFLSNCEYAA